jgi:hypothetical protein
MVTNRVGVNGTEGARTASVITLIAGIWLIISPFWMGYFAAPVPLWNTLILGIVVGVLALIRACYPAENVWLSWINLLLGLWLIVSPWFLPYHGLMVPLRCDVITGIVIVVTALWSALATPTYSRLSRYSR